MKRKERIDFLKKEIERIENEPIKGEIDIYELEEYKKELSAFDKYNQKYEEYLIDEIKILLNQSVNYSKYYEDKGIPVYMIGGIEIKKINYSMFRLAHYTPYYEIYINGEKKEYISHITLMKIWDMFNKRNNYNN